MSDFVCLCVRCLSAVALKSALPACVPLYPLAVSLASGQEVSGRNTVAHNMYICKYVYMYLCIHVDMFICIYVHVYIYMCIYIHM